MFDYSDQLNIFSNVFTVLISFRVWIHAIFSVTITLDETITISLFDTWNIA